MSQSIATNPTGGQLIGVSALALMVSLATMGGLITLLVSVSEGMIDPIASVGSIMMGPFLGLIFGPVGFPASTGGAIVLFLLFGRGLAAREASTGTYRRVLWLAAGASVGLMVATMMRAELLLYSSDLPSVPSNDLPLYGVALATGVVGMFFWHALMCWLTRNGTGVPN